MDQAKSSILLWKIVRYSAVVAVPAPALANGLSFADAIGSGKDGKTVITLGAASASGNTFVYKVSTDSNAVATPNVGDTLAGWTAVANGDEITAANGKHIGVAEIDSTGKVVQFSDAVAVTVDYVAATSASVEAANDAVLTTDLSGKTASLVVKVDGSEVDNTFTLVLDNKTASAYDINTLKTAIEGAANSSAAQLSTVANVTLVGNKIVITSKTTGTSSTVTVSFTGTDAADAAALTGFTSSGQSATGVAEAN